MNFTIILPILLNLNKFNSKNILMNNHNVKDILIIKVCNNYNSSSNTNSYNNNKIHNHNIKKINLKINHFNNLILITIK